MFAGCLKYMGETPEEVPHATAIEIAQKLLHQAIKRPDLKDELYMHLIKQTRGNPNNKTKLKAWELFFLVASTVPPSKLYIGLVSEYIHSFSNEDSEPELRKRAEATWRALKRSAKAGARHTLPSFEEIDAALRNQPLQTIVFFLDETFEDLHYDITTTVLEAVEQLASIIKLHNYTTFTLFECRKLADRSLVDAAQDEHVLLDDHKYIADVLYEIRSVRGGKEAYNSRLLFKKRMFRETDETITEPQFVNLSYVQAQFDYLQGNYPVVRDDAAQMCALQIQAECGPTILDQEDAIMDSIEKYAPGAAACRWSCCVPVRCGSRS
jgi:MyTH4 domain/FERM central domain